MLLVRDETALDRGRLHRLLQFLEGARLDLPGGKALAREVMRRGKPKYRA
jgi:hypothetical protein